MTLASHLPFFLLTPRNLQAAGQVAVEMPIGGWGKEKMNGVIVCAAAACCKLLM
jgi:hypothetical protein